MAADVTLIICLKSPVGRVGNQPTLQRHRCCPCFARPSVARYIGPNWSVALTEVGRLGWADMRAGAVTTSCASRASQPPTQPPPPKQPKPIWGAQPLSGEHVHASASTVIKIGNGMRAAWLADLGNAATILGKVFQVSFQRTHTHVRQ